MKNLNDYNVKKMGNQELRQYNGGDFGLTLALIALGIAILNTDWDQVGDDISRGWSR